MKFFFKNDQMDSLFQIFLIFQLLFGGLINQFSCTKLLVVTCRRVVNYVVVTDSHTWWGNGFFLKKKVKIVISQHFEIFTFFIFQIKVSVSQQIFNCWGWNRTQMFTCGLYYPLLTITPFWPNGPFTYEMAHLWNLQHHPKSAKCTKVY